MYQELLLPPENLTIEMPSGRLIALFNYTLQSWIVWLHKQTCWFFKFHHTVKEMALKFIPSFILNCCTGLYSSHYFCCNLFQKCHHSRGWKFLSEVQPKLLKSGQVVLICRHCLFCLNYSHSIFYSDSVGFVCFLGLVWVWFYFTRQVSQISSVKNPPVSSHQMYEKTSSIS